MPAALRLAFPATVRVVDRVHRGPAHRGPLPEPPAPTGLADGLVLMVGVSDLTHGGATREQDTTHLAGRNPEHRIAGVLRDELDAGAGRAGHLRALPRLQLDVVHHRARWDVLQRKRVPGL